MPRRTIIQNVRLTRTYINKKFIWKSKKVTLQYYNKMDIYFILCDLKFESR